MLEVKQEHLVNMQLVKQLMEAYQTFEKETGNVLFVGDDGRTLRRYIILLLLLKQIYYMIDEETGKITGFADWWLYDSVEELRHKAWPKPFPMRLGSGKNGYCGVAWLERGLRGRGILRIWRDWWLKTHPETPLYYHKDSTTFIRYTRGGN